MDPYRAERLRMLGREGEPRLILRLQVAEVYGIPATAARWAGQLTDTEILEGHAYAIVKARLEQPGRRRRERPGHPEWEAEQDVKRRQNG